ncbi:MAG: signal peptidase II [Acidobacteriota bacterium]|nr:MAG: signal peptidase II [Acidobacteriota bacterium]
MLAKSGYLIITIIVLAIDQLTKYWAVKSLKPVLMIEVIPGFFRFTYATNRGVAFSLFADSEMNVPVIFAVISIIAALVVLLYLARTPPGRMLTSTALSLLLAGIIGNLIDRIRLGEVIDFIDVHLADKYTWPTFNIADSAICVGAILLALEMIRDERAARAGGPAKASLIEDGGVGTSE